ncbi:MAG: kynureninase [Paraglaciecola sp.]|jgi:kynureninase
MPKRSPTKGQSAGLYSPDAHAICQVLIEQAVIADFRAPDVLRFGFGPLYLRYIDIGHTIDILLQIVESGIYRQPRFREKLKVA